MAGQGPGHYGTLGAGAFPVDSNGHVLGMKGLYGAFPEEHACTTNGKTAVVGMDGHELGCWISLVSWTDTGWENRCNGPPSDFLFERVMALLLLISTSEAQLMRPRCLRNE